MEPSPDTPPPADADRWTRAQTLYVGALFVGAWALVGVAAARTGALPQDAAELATAAFFLCYGLFTISIGYQHSHHGYYSFDRVAQVASILVLGPVLAACVNGLASFLYPWHRLRKGVPVKDVTYAALNNSGLMASIVLGAGSAYVSVGGSVPLTDLTAATVAAYRLAIA